MTGERAGADFVDGMFAYQGKLGRRCPAYLRCWLAEIVTVAERRQRIGIVIWKPKGAQDRDALVLLRFADWLELHVSKPLHDAPRTLVNAGHGAIAQQSNGG